MKRLRVRLIIATCVAVAAVTAAFAQRADDAKRPVNLDASRITIDVTDAPVAEVAKRFAKQSGNRPFVFDRVPPGRTVTLSLKDVPYWQAVDRFCMAAKLDYRSGVSRGSQRELRLVNSPPTAGPVVYAGPVVLRLEGVSRRRWFRPEKSNAGLNHYANCVARYEWEERLPAVDSEVWLTELLTPDGTDMIGVYGTKPPRRLTNHMGTWNGPPGMFHIFVGHPPEALKKLARIEGYFLFEFAAGKQELKIDDVQGDKPSAADDRRGVTVLKTWWIGNSLVVTLKMSAKGGATWPPLRARTGPGGRPYGFLLEGPDGKRYAGRPTTRIPQLADKLKAFRKNEPAESEISFRFYRLPRDVKRWSLVWVTPETHDVRKYPFVVREVPIR